MSNVGRHIIALAIVKNPDGEVLIARRKKPVEGADGSVFTWGFPGGKSHEYDSLEEAASLCTLEETGYYVEIKEKLGSRKHEHHPVHLHYYIAEMVEEKSTGYIADEDIVQIAWVAPKELSDYFGTDLYKKAAGYLGI